MILQIEQNYGKGSYGYLYITTNETDTLDHICNMVKLELLSDFKKESEIGRLFGSAVPCYPTVHVREYKDGKRVKNGLRFKTKWR